MARQAWPAFSWRFFLPQEAGKGEVVEEAEQIPKRAPEPSEGESLEEITDQKVAEDAA